MVNPVILRFQYGFDENATSMILIRFLKLQLKGNVYD